MSEELKLPKLFSEGCVLQQNEEIRVWGSAMPKSTVHVFLGDDKENVGQTVNTDEQGHFSAMLQEMTAGGPYQLKVTDDRGCEVSIREVYVGEVYVCGGQSNMELPMSRVRERYPEEFYNGGAPQVHLYKVKEYYDFKAPLEEHVEASWTICSSDNLEEISAFSYFFGKQLQEHFDVPVGMINLSLGGTPVEAWMSQDGIKDWKEIKAIREHYLDQKVCLAETSRQEDAEQDWQKCIQEKEEAFCASEWKKIELPGSLDRADELKGFCGCIWFRKTFIVPENREGSPGLLRFGTMVDSDHIYINGHLIGETGYCYPPRRYEIEKGLLKAGENEILIRLVVRAGGGRFTEEKPYEIIWDDPKSPGEHLSWNQSPSGEGIGEDKIVLKGEWQYQIRAVTKQAPEQLFLNRVPTGLFHGMVSPCLPYKVRGAVWYQGESNDSRPDSYGEMLKGMIADWREKWQQDKLPFIIAQLPNCGIDTAEGEAWPKIREAQRQAGEIADVSVTVNIDLGEDYDLHPLNKKDVAARAVLAARSMIYGEEVISSGPEVSACKQKHGSVLLTYRTNDKSDELVLGKPGEESAGRKKAEDSSLFELAGEDECFYPAEANINGNHILVQSNKVTMPVYVRYAWSRTPGKQLIYNESGLPAGPFRRRTDEKII